MKNIRIHFKKITVLALSLLIAFSAWIPLRATQHPVFAEAYPGIAAKLKGHWSEKYIKPQMIELYLPQYAYDSFQKFQPSEFITQSAVFHALKVMYREYGILPLDNKADQNKVMKRKDIFVLLAPVVAKYEKEGSPEPAFQDVKNLTKEERATLTNLVALGIIQGVSKTAFAPDRDMTQSEAVIVLQRVYDLIATPFADALPKKSEKLSFVVSDYKRSYDSKEGIAFHEDADFLYITITKRFSTPSYTLQIMRVFASDKGFHVDLKTTGLMEGAIVPQVITYESVTVQIPRSEIPKHTPYEVIGAGVEGGEEK